MSPIVRRGDIITKIQLNLTVAALNVSWYMQWLIKSSPFISIVIYQNKCII
jgi:hypothetical protein